MINTPTNGGDTITILVVAVAPKISANVNGVTLTNQVTFTYTASPVITVPLVLTIVEPVLVQRCVGEVFYWHIINNMCSAKWNTTVGQAGDVLKCTLTISHAASSTAPALYPDIYMQLSPNMDFQSATLHSNITSVASPKNSTLQSTWTPLNSIARLPLGTSLSVTFTVVLNVSLRAGSTLPADFITLYTSSDDPSQGRSNQVTPNHLVVTIQPLPVSVFAVTNTSDPLVPWGFVAQGEGITHFVNITVPKGTTLNVKVVVTFPSSVGLVRVTDITIASLPSYMTTTGYATGLTDTNNDKIADTATLVIGALTNYPTGVSSDSNQAVFAFTGTVVPSSLNNAGVILVTSAQFSYSNGTATSTEAVHSTSLQLVQPILVWTVVWSTASGDAGDIVTCAITIQHAATSSQIAYDIDIVAQLAPYHDLNVTSIVTSDLNPSAAPFWKTGYDGIIFIPQLKLNNVVTVNFATVIDNSILASSVVHPVVIGNYSSSASGGQNWYPSRFRSFSFFFFFDPSQDSL